MPSPCAGNWTMKPIGNGRGDELFTKGQRHTKSQAARKTLDSMTDGKRPAVQDAGATQKKTQPRKVARAASGKGNRAKPQTNGAPPAPATPRGCITPPRAMTKKNLVRQK